MTTTRKPRLGTLLVLLSAILTVPVAADAKDLCVTLESPATTIVLKGFSLPGRGKCKPVGGWMPDRTLKDLVTGLACRFSDGSQVWITLQSTPTHIESGFGYTESYVLLLSTDTLDGTASFHILTHATPPTTGAGSSTATGDTCDPQNVPFP